MENVLENQKRIRNFSIIAHIDHGKSTLADRLLEMTGTVEARNMSKQMMDTLELEQERGITIKLQAARMLWDQDKTEYILNLIDTPGHVDFSYEVSRSLAACEGALLVVDASQGVEAQTISTIMQALDNDLEIIPVLNKIDLPGAEVEKVSQELKNMFGFEEHEILKVSAKTGVGVKELLDAIVEKIPAPVGEIDKPAKGLIFDSFYDEHKGVVALIKLEEGVIEKKNTYLKIRSIATRSEYEPIEIGYLYPDMKNVGHILTGEVGYLATGLKDIKQIRVGDTVTLASQFTEAYEALPGYKQPLPMVYAGMFPLSNDEFRVFREAFEKLTLNDASLYYTPEHSTALGPGFRCGFLGLLHMEIIKERLEKEFGIDTLITTPSVRYELTTTSGEEITMRSPQDMPDASRVEQVREPWASVEIITPNDYVGPIMQLCQEKRGIYQTTEYMNKASEDLSRAILKYEIPMAELITDFFDTLKSLSKGYASLDYVLKEFRAGDIVKVDILINNEVVPPLSFLTHNSSAVPKGKKTVTKLKEVIPRQMFKVPIQAAIGSNFIARVDISAYRKDVTEKLYGGDITRKMKLREKQKKGKKRMKMFGKVELPQEAFLATMSKD